MLRLTPIRLRPAESLDSIPPKLDAQTGCWRRDLTIGGRIKEDRDAKLPVTPLVGALVALPLTVLADDVKVTDRTYVRHDGASDSVITAGRFGTRRSSFQQVSAIRQHATTG